MEKEQKRKRTQVTERTFKAAKIMISAGASRKEVAEYLDIGITTVDRIRAAENWVEYKNILSAMFAKKDNGNSQMDRKQEEKTVVEHRQTVTVQASHYMLEEQKKTNELLVSISNKLAFIVEQLS